MLLWRNDLCLVQWLSTLTRQGTFLNRSELQNLISDLISLHGYSLRWRDLRGMYQASLLWWRWKWGVHRCSCLWGGWVLISWFTSSLNDALTSLMLCDCMEHVLKCGMAAHSACKADYKKVVIDCTDDQICWYWTSRRLSWDDVAPTFR